ncbi:flavin-containing monooxygenase FMO GS-OX-like 8 [Lolium rigidum]|uniref:flavin-containing monooxygenase FMO GS-OX-like 8 n=1 Tax=Lolium rigidum TaxID=89674 RepID=UPI001F5D0398|nr:flavin-containing monooxygenase FMO GS-OX-like 8 [Lolium rigidum]
MVSASDGEQPLQLQSKNVCVVGAGMAGMAAARELRREGHAVTVMEQSADVGGQWLYDPRTDGDDPLGATVPVRVPGSMYACLRLISPREAMGFSDFQFLPRHGVAGRDPRRYPVHQEMYCYLRDFCDAFGLMDAVRLSTRVLRVAEAVPTSSSSTRQWAVRSVHLGDGKEKEEVFDSVVVATGHYSQPKLPRIKGMEEWLRRQMHSHSYRTPDPFRGEVVVMVGCGDSGKDIALDLRRVAKEVHLTAKSTEEAMTPAMSKMLANHANLHLHPQIDQLHADGRVVFADGSSVVADTVMYGTGYTYSFPFLDTGGAVTVDDNRVGPLFEHVFPPSLAPSLSFVGVPRKVLIPWFFEAQGKWIAQVLSGRRALPPEEEMLRSVEEHYRAREAAGVPKKYTHDIGGVEPLKMYEFGEKYCDFPRIENWQRELILSGIAGMNEDMENFRDRTDDSDNVRKGLQRWLGLAAPPQAQDDQNVAGKDIAATQVDAQAMTKLLVN